MMKKLTEYVPLIAIASAFLAGVIGVYAGMAIADHDENEKAHPTIVQSVRDNSAENKLITQKVDLKLEGISTKIDDNQLRLLDAITSIQKTLVVIQASQ